MTVSSIKNDIQYNGDGVTTSFPVPFYFIEKSDLVIERGDGQILTTLILDRDYSVTGDGDESGGTVILNNPLSRGYQLNIWRNPEATQETEYYEGGKFPAKSHERALDKLTMLVQRCLYFINDLILKKDSSLSDSYNAKNQRISNIAMPVEGPDAVNKQYFDNAIVPFIQEAEQILSDAMAQADRSESEADRSMVEANRSKSEADKSKLQADNSAREAGKSKTEADRSKAEADRAEEAAQSVDADEIKRLIDALKARIDEQDLLIAELADAKELASHAEIDNDNGVIIWNKPLMVSDVVIMGDVTP